jgi:hypothetical protein
MSGLLTIFLMPKKSIETQPVGPQLTGAAITMWKQTRRRKGRLVPIISSWSPWRFCHGLLLRARWEWGSLGGGELGAAARGLRDRGAFEQREILSVLLRTLPYLYPRATAVTPPLKMASFCRISFCVVVEISL